jgi:endonuclease IV
MILGIQLAMLCDESIDAAISHFQRLQEDFPLNACEIHLEASLYRASVWPWDDNGLGRLHELRKGVSKLGVHLPFMDLNLFSRNMLIQEASRKVLIDSVTFAGRIQADYVVMHIRKPADSPMPLDLKLLRKELKQIFIRSHESGCAMLIENADDLRAPEDVASLAEQIGETAGICLDIGHLFEREYPRSRLAHRLLRFNDLFSPRPFLIKYGIPASGYGDWPAVASSLSHRIGCVHVHNHDGRIAHKPLSAGRIDLAPLRSLAQTLRNVPLILEADYRGLSPDKVRSDLTFLSGLLNNG